MLTFLRSITSSWAAKILLGLLVASFAVWGVEGVFLNAGTQSVATVGEQTVSTNEFARNFQRALDTYNRQNGTGLTMAQAYEQGLYTDILTEMVVDALYAEEARRMGITASDQKVATEVHSMDAFKDSLGKFDKRQFDFIMQQSGYTEAQFIDLMRRDLVQQEMIRALTDGATVPQTMVDTIFAHRGEERTVEYIVLTEDSLGALPEPDEATLKAYHETHAELFTSEETRDISVLSLAASDLTDDVEVTEEEIKTAYSDQAHQLIKPETRSIERVVFADIETARAARARVEAGETLTDVGAELTGLSENDILRLNAQKEDLEASEAEIAFSLDEGAVSEPIATDFGPVLIRVAKITPAVVPPLDEVQKQIADELRLEKAADVMFDMIEKLEDLLAGGSTLEEASEAVGVSIKTVKGLNRAGLIDGTPATGLPPHDGFLDTVFDADQGYDSDLTEADDGSYYVVRADAVHAATLQPFETVKDQVRAAWIADQRADRLTKAAEDRRAGLTAAGLPALAKDMDVAVRVSVPLNRFQVPEGFTQATVDAVFAAPAEGAVIDAPSANGHLLGVVTTIRTPSEKDAPAVYAQMERLLDQSFLVDLAAQFQSGLEGDIGVDINERALSLLFDQNQ